MINFVFNIILIIDLELLKVFAINMQTAVHHVS